MHGTASRLRVVPPTVTSAEVSPLPIRRPRPDAYPVTVECGCEPEGVEMIRSANCDRGLWDSPAQRFADGCNELFECPLCSNRELFPAPSMTVADIKRFYPGWGARRNAGHGSAA